MTTTFTYAEDYDSPIQRLCLETFKRHNPGGTVYDPESFRALPGAEDYWQRICSLSPYHRSDVIRLVLLEMYGGLWLDADCIHLRNAEYCYDIQPDQLGVCLNSNQSGEIANTILFAPRPGLPIVRRLIERQMDLIEKKQSELAYLDLGVLEHRFLQSRESRDIFVAPHWEYMYLPWFVKHQFMVERKDWDFELDRGFYNPNAFCYHLTHPVLEWMAGYSRDRCLKVNNFVGFLLRRATGTGLDGLKTREILARLPDLHGQYQFVEVGVHRGDVSRLVGQQRCRAMVHLVDPWEQQPETGTYRKSGDGLALLTNDEQENIYRYFLENIWFLRSQKRANILREYSVAAASRFPNASLDMVFIDANHSFDAVLQDIRVWKPKLKSRGWIGGHDYGFAGLEGVKQAVDHWANHATEVEFGDDYTWFARMQ